MSNAIVIDSKVFSFRPTSPEMMTSDSGEMDRSSASAQVLEQEIREDLEAQFQQRVEQEVNARIAVERSRFETKLAANIKGFDELIQSMRKDIQNKVVDLSIRLSEIIVRHELPDREMLSNLIVKTLEPISDLQGAMVRLSSHDWKLFGEEISAGDHLGVGSTVKFAEDPNLSEGDVIVESRNGIFDARLSERLKLLKESLHERSGRKAPESDEL